MDPARQRSGEDDADFFRRLEIVEGVDAYFIILPSRAKLLGTIFEGGMLVRDFHYGRAPSLTLFVERPLIAADGRGGFEFVARGKRTRYLRSLVGRAHHVQIWETVEELLASILDRADADP